MSRGLGCTFYGVEGIGKTEFSLQFPKELACVSIEESGYEDLDDFGKVPEGCVNFDIKTIGNLMLFLKKKAGDFRTVVIDSLSGLENLIAKAVCDQDFNGDMSKYSAYYVGPRKHAPPWASRVCTELDALRSKGTNIILIGHSKIELIKNPNGHDYNANLLDIDEGVRGVFTKWAQAVIFMTLDTEVMATKTVKGKVIEAKANNDLLADSDRIMYTTKHPTHSAKSRIDLPTYISMGDSAKEAYENFVKVFPPGKVKDNLVQ